MEHKRFFRLVHQRMEEVTERLETRGREYSKPEDKFYNFRRAAGCIQTSKEKALEGMMVKHFVSVSDIIDNLDDMWPSETQWDEKITDILAYLFILDGMVKERYDKEVVCE